MQTPTQIQNFIAYIQNHFKGNIKYLRSDNGTEFFQDFYSDLFRKHGIEHQRSVPKTPQQNGRVERKHRHLVETTRVMRIYANLPYKFWGACILTATHIINRLPSANRQWKSPYQVLFQCHPDLTGLRVIGSLCYALDLNQTNKFGAKARKCIFIGYPQGQKAYKLYDLETHKTFVSRDVRFMEHILPFKQTDTQDTAPNARLFPTLPVAPEEDILQHDQGNAGIPMLGHGSPLALQHPSVSQDLPTAHISPRIDNVPAPSVPIQSVPAPVRRSNRISQPPAWLQDFAYNTTIITPHTAKVLYPLYKPEDFQNLKPQYRTSLFNVLSTSKPSTILKPRVIQDG